MNDAYTHAGKVLAHHGLNFGSTSIEVAEKLEALETAADPLGLLARNRGLLEEAQHHVVHEQGLVDKCLALTEKLQKAETRIDREVDRANKQFEEFEQRRTATVKHIKQLENEVKCLDEALATVKQALQDMTAANEVLTANIRRQTVRDQSAEETADTIRKLVVAAFERNGFGLGDENQRVLYEICWNVLRSQPSNEALKTENRELRELLASVAQVQSSIYTRISMQTKSHAERWMEENVNRGLNNAV